VAKPDRCQSSTPEQNMTTKTIRHILEFEVHNVKKHYMGLSITKFRTTEDWMYMSIHSWIHLFVP